MTIVLDADVVIGALDRAASHHRASRDLFAAWHRDGTRRLLGLLNLTEVLTAPARSAQSLRTAREAIAALGVTVHAPNEAIAVDAARLRSAHPISLPDAYALATARHVGCGVMTFDRKLVVAAGHEAIG